MATTLHSDAQGASRIVGQSLRQAYESGVLTNTNVADATTASGLKTIVSAASVHADQKPILDRINKGIDIGIADTSLNDTDLQAATTVNGLAGLTYSSAGELGLWE